MAHRSRRSQGKSTKLQATTHSYCCLLTVSTTWVWNVVHIGRAHGVDSPRTIKVDVVRRVQPVPCGKCNSLSTASRSNGVLSYGQWGSNAPPKLSRMPKGITQDAETVMSLTLGHPRAVEAVADVKKPHCSLKELCEYAAPNLSVRYRMTTPDVEVPHLLNMCFKELSVAEARKLDPVIASGLMTLNNWRLEIAPLWLVLQRNLGSPGYQSSWHSISRSVHMYCRRGQPASMICTTGLTGPVTET